MTNEHILFDGTPHTTTWAIVNDTVMGGKSTSRVTLSPSGSARFQGNVSLDGGGFASVRLMTGPLDLSGCEGIALTASGDGKSYDINVRSYGMEMLSYRSRFTATEQPQTIHFAFAEMQPSVRGQIVRGAPTLDLSQIEFVGFIISQGQEGPFVLDVDVVAAYGCS